MRKSSAILIVCALLSCARNPVTGKRELALVSESDEIELGRQGAKEVADTVGLVDDPALTKYVSDVGLALAKRTERPNLPWTFRVVDDPAVNAFALPGGFVFVTRGLLEHLSNEAELASVVGHEIGHVTARHSVQQISRQQLAQLGLGLGTALVPQLQQYGQIAGAGLQLLFLKYSRDDESQADELGFRYALSQDYDVRAMADVFRMLDQVSKGAGGRLPEWLATHPNPENRVQKTEARAQQAKVEWAQLKRAPEALESHLPGLTFGADPRAGYFSGNRFYAPALKFQLDLPAGWKRTNAETAVTAESPQGDGAMQLKLAGTSPPSALLQKFAAQEGIRTGNAGNLDLHGTPATTASFEAQSDSGPIIGQIAYFTYGGRTWQLLAISTKSSEAAYANAIRQSFLSFQPLTDPAILGVQPARLRLEKLTQPTTIADLARRGKNVDVAEIALLNRAHPGDTLPAGRVARWVEGTVPSEK